MELLVSLNDWLWDPLVVLALGLGLALTVLTRAVQLRRIPDMIRQLRHGERSDAGVSSFQALALTLSSRIGVGNIAGVATAIAAGGPGALFWMFVTGFLGGATAFVESTLAQIYKSKSEGAFWGGIPYYIEKGLRKRWLAVVAAVTAISLYAVLAPGVQSNTIAAGFDQAMGVNPWITGTVLVGLLGFVIFGERKRIVAVADRVVPFMAVGYIAVALVVLAVHITEVPATLSLVIRSAVGADSVFGGIIGAAVAWGVRRAVFSNVAGVGEGTYASAAAEASHPAKQGLVQSFSIYIDTLFVCTATGLMILVTGNYNVETESGRRIVTHLEGVEAGPAYTQAAVDSVLTGIGPYFVAVAIGLFAFTSLVAFYYIAHTSLTYLTRGIRTPALVQMLRIAMLAMTFYGAVESADMMWAIGDVGYAALGWVNMVCIIFLAKPALKALRDYEEQRRLGLDPVFDPEKLGITDADYWTRRPAPIPGSVEPAPDHSSAETNGKRKAP
ncbi:Sodium_proton-dependent alanine carrier protein [Streptomyces sp. enrichment culture]|uniref:alanine/glycine:cation symporter family protein n=1 Tax=Streptomyces sp. enrichment culture TaxID=1795815 RepID=UPI003F57965B